MKQYYVNIVRSMAALAVLTSPVLGSPQKKLRRGNPLEQEDSVRRQHRVLERNIGGRPSIVEGKLGKLGVDPKKASGK
jgi:hypothetical protein